MASKVLTWIAAVAATVALWGAPDASAQQPFAAAATVDGTAITNYQVGQRALFYGLLRAPDADFEGALDRLIDETLQVREAEEAGVELSPEELDAGLEEFAQRAELSRDAFVAALAEAGVAFETYRDFVSNGLLIRRLVQQRFGERARPSDGEIEQALARGAGGGVRLLLSEIALPLNPETQTEVQALADQLSQTVSSQAEFERAARTYSRAASARAGGRLDWIPLGQLAPPIASQVLTLGPGEISEPVNLGSFIGLFLLRDLDESAATSPSSGIVDFAEYRIPGGRTPEALGRARARSAPASTPATTSSGSRGAGRRACSPARRSRSRPCLPTCARSSRSSMRTRSPRCSRGKGSCAS